MTIYLSENIKRLRRENNLTQETLAEFLGVTFQSVSNWERGESYPDITMLPEIASFFKVSIEELLGVNKSESEEEIIKELEAYDNLTDEKFKLEIINKLKKKYPNDFRILLRYMTSLIHFKENTPDTIAKIVAIYENIKQNCNNDKIRISAKRHIVELYKDLSEINGSAITFEDCENIIKEMPRMRDGQEMFFNCYPDNHPERTAMIQEAIEEEIFLLDNTLSRYLYDSRYSAEYRIALTEKAIEFFNFLYDDGNYGRMWRFMLYNHGHLGLRYYELDDIENALKNFRKMSELATKFDSMDRITVMHSVMFEGKKFDKHILGTTYIAKMQVKELLTKKYPLSDEFKAMAEFKEIIGML